MTPQRQKGFIFSALLHFFWLLFAIFGLPLLVATRPPPEPTAISVELLPISTITNVKPSESQPAEQEKEAKKQEQKKPAPPVKTAQDTPPPPPKPSDVVKPQEKKPEEKKPEPKKQEKKQKPEDLAAVLAAVKDTAQKDKKTDDKAKDTSKSKSTSDVYNANLPMSMSEKDAIRSQIAKCWNVPAGAKDAHELLVVLDLEVAQDGSVIKVELADASKSRYNSDNFFRAAADSAMRAVRECSPIQNLPPDKYDTWHMMEMTFDPKEMLF